MKRRAVSFLIVLALCLSLCPMRAMAAGMITYTVTEDSTFSETYEVTSSMRLNMQGYSYTIKSQPAVSVQNKAELYLIKHGTIESTKGIGIEVQAGCALYVDDPGMTVIGTTYGLDIASGAKAELSGGTFKGAKGAIQAEDGDYAALLASGCAYFDENETPIPLYAGFNESGDPVPLTTVKDKTTVMVKACADHSYIYTPDAGIPTHSGICLYCGKPAPSPEKCTFVFDANGSAACADCQRKITVTIDINKDSLVYDGTGKPDSDAVKVTVTLTGSTGKTLTNGTDYDYTVTPSSRTDVGDFTVTVTGKTYNGTFAKTFRVTQAKPGITWASTDPVEVDYDGYPVDETDLPKVQIIPAIADDLAELEQLLYFSYKKVGDTGFTVGLPADVGTYEIIASLPETQNYEAASSEPITLKIKKIYPIIEAPVAVKPVYNGAAQELVTGGKVNPDAVGAVILFATSKDGPWSADIPTGTSAGDYVVWYKVEETDNYDGVEATSIDSVKIRRKEITPDVVLEYTSHAYTGGELQPTVIVSDKDDGTVLHVTEYAVGYRNNINVGTDATVIVSDKDKGNYKIVTVEVKFEITEADQDGLTITNKPDSVAYGDVFTLNTSGGSGNGTVTWTIVSGNSATIDQASGQVTVTGLGTVTVRATRSGTDYKTATAEWTFTVGPKHVTATVTADNKIYDGTNTAAVTAAVDPDDLVLPGDTVTIDGLSGTFSNANAGTGKTVNVNAGSVQIGGDGKKAGTEGNVKYIVTIPGTTTADITKAQTRIETPPTAAASTYNGDDQPLVNAATAGFTTTVTNTGAIQVEYALSESGPYSTAIPKAADAGSYEVWYRVRGTDNYFGTTAAKVNVTISPKPVTPDVTLPSANEYNYVYDGSEKKPAVTVKYTENGAQKEVPSSEYTVTYSNHVNAGTNTATVTVTSKTGGNYKFTATEKFTIDKADAVLTVTPQAVAGLVYNGQAQNLVSAGTATGGHLEYSLTGNDDYSSTIPQRKDAKTYTVYYKVVGDSNHNGINTPSVVYVTLSPKTVVSPVITLAGESGNTPYSVVYDGSPKTPGVTSVVDDGITIDSGEYTVTYSNNINVGTATVHITDKNGGNYTVNGETTFEITKATAAFTTEPAAKQNLTYNGKPQPLVSAGVSNDGTVVYSQEAGVYSTAIPTETDRGNYTVWAKVLGDGNHEDSAVKTIYVTIDVNAVANPTVELSPTSFQYNGSEQKPTVTVKDDKGNVIPENEYTVTYEKVTDSTEQASAETIDVGTYKIIIKSKDGSNYSFTENTHTFKILPADQTALTITNMPDIVYYGDTIQLSVTGGTGNGTVEWSIEKGNDKVKKGDSNGQFIIIGTGSITVKATRTSASGNYEKAEAEWEFYAYPKPVNAVVTAKNKVYDGNTTAELSVAVPVSGITIAVHSDVTGIFDSADVGTNKTVGFTIIADYVSVTGNEDKNYAITYPGESTTTASITPAAASLSGISVEKIADLMYSRVSQELVTVSGTAAGGDLAFSLDGTNYDLNIPTGLNAGMYKVRYKVLGDKNHTDSNVETVTVEIKKATPNIAELPVASPINSDQSLKDSKLDGGRAIFKGVEVPGTFTWENDASELQTGTYAYDVTFTPADGVNYESVEGIEVNVTVIEEDSEPTPEPGPTPDQEPTPAPETPGSSSSAHPGTESPSTQTTVRNGTASTVLNSAAGNELADKAVANQSKNVVIKPEITGNVTKTEVSIPASAVKRIGNETDASITVSTPIADVTIPNGVLGALSNGGGTVSVAAEQVNNTVVLSLTANGRDVGILPGGLTLTVPVENAGPGTVAVLVYADGTRETIRKSVAENGGVRIPLNGSATVEIVDNSKKFTDVPAESWAADAVAFASAHEMFNGTGETTFSPERSMSRAMLATVLYNLESNPDTAFNGTFADVGGDAWYAESVSWAAARGIVTGYGNGSFGANDSITREQLAVMLWRYAGSPAADGQAFDFTDAGQVSSYAMEALRWAAANGILNGYGNGRIDPAGQATRAQAAQMLKNFMENT